MATIPFGLEGEHRRTVTNDVASGVNDLRSIGRKERAAVVMEILGEPGRFVVVIEVDQIEFGSR